jgi:phage terminase large subunit GpA-like protein
MAPSSVLARARAALRPPPRLSLSEWADRYFYLSPESAAEPGRWRTLPYQRGIMDAITDPAVEQVSFMKSARVGATKMMGAAIGYYLHQDPCPIMVVQPTVEDAQGYSKEEIAPMLRDCEVLAQLAGEATARTPDQTILHKVFAGGGSLTMVGANSGRGFRRVSRRVVIFDEVDGYPPSAGAEGDQIKLGIRRTEYYWNRKIIAASTPLTAGASRIEEMFEAGDQRRYHVPCPQCGHEDILVFNEDERGHWMQWPEDEPAAAHFVCSGNGCVIEEHHKREMLERGEWRANAEFHGHASFHIWAAYSLSPNATWGQIAAEFLEAKRQGPEKLKTFVNTGLGETWHERGEAPEWERLYHRRETYPIGSVPAGVRFLTSGVDVQKDRFVYDVTGWGDDKQSWSIDAGVIMGDTSDEKSWAQLDELQGRTFPGIDGRTFSIAMMAIDSGYNTQQVYNWARRHPMSRVIACKGMARARTLLGVPSPVDVTVRGKRMQRGYKVWPVGVGIAKSELYGWLRLPAPLDGESFPPGYCHFPEHGPEYFRQLTAEHLVQVRKRSGFVLLEWQLLPNRENHWLDARVLARAAAAALGLDRMQPRGVVANQQAPDPESRIHVAPPLSPPAPQVERSGPRKPGGWLSSGRQGSKRPGGWLGRRR